MAPKSKKTATRPTARAANAKDNARSSTLGKRKPLGPGTTLAGKRKKIAEEEGWQQQYYQGRNILELKGMGCGQHTFGIEEKILDFKSPFDESGRIEIMSGTKDAGEGSIRLFGPDNWHGDVLAGELTMLIPFRHIEQILVETTAPQGKKTRSASHRVFIIPTGAVGTSSLKRELPSIIEFRMPDRKRDDCLKGAIGEAKLTSENATYLAAFSTACNHQLKGFGKEVMKIGDERGAAMHFPAVWKRDSDTTLGPMGKDQGILHLLPNALFFASISQNENRPYRHIYIPLGFKNTLTNPALADGIWLVVDKDVVYDTTGNYKKLEKPKAVNLSLWIRGVKESPIYHHGKGDDEKPQEGQKKMRSVTVGELRRGVQIADSNELRDSDLLVFTGLSLELLDTLPAYIKKHYAQQEDGGIVENQRGGKQISGARSDDMTKASDQDEDAEDKDNDDLSIRKRNRIRGDDKKPQNEPFQMLQMLYFDYSQNQLMTGLLPYEQ